MSITPIDLETGGLLFADITYEFCITISDGSTVSTSGSTLTQAVSGSEIYLLENPNITEDTVFRVFVVADATKEAKGVFSPADGDLALQSTLTNATYGLSALQTLVEAMDTSTELQARFDEIKGAGWTTETLKSIKELIDASQGSGFDTNTHSLKQIKNTIG